MDVRERIDRIEERVNNLSERVAALEPDENTPTAMGLADAEERIESLEDRCDRLDRGLRLIACAVAMLGSVIVIGLTTFRVWSGASAHHESAQRCLSECNGFAMGREINEARGNCRAACLIMFAGTATTSRQR